ncbi:MULTISPECIES: helix-turn-helix transcriptional regulator [unclassified Streptomyces]|uniref:helix-turn-helix domain-containing protein n=1 Tax=unclassified Streptomyces TaxID=2593676 RepID=UPI000CD49CAD|nr:MULTISPECIES: helix-turn-helix transcriptional regulator [unclassified Streptomyces]AWL41656.1 XRE family transcriptional regulator [Streptomyces sp. SM18]
MAETERDEGAVGFLRCFGAQLRLLREREGLTRAELGSRLGYGEDQIASVELGRRIPKPEMIDRADEVLGAGGLLSAMKAEVARARYPSFFQHAAKLESEAVELHVYDTLAVNGLLQTEDYARAVFRQWRPFLDEEVVDQRCASRMARQEIFNRRPVPNLSFVIEEAVLHKRIGGDQVWRGQLEQVLLIGQRRNVEIQVMPLGRCEHAGLAGPFTLMETGDGRRVAYTEVQSDGRLHTERGRVRELEATYGAIRGQARAPQESMALIEKLLGEA